MALDTVPWMVDGGLHSAEVGRALAHLATKGKSGISQIDDFLVRAKPTAGTEVLVGAGVAAIANTYPQQVGQSYVVRNTADEAVAITQTTGAARSDMLILRIDDPQYGGTEPDNEELGPYVRFAILSNVGPTATSIPAGVGYPAIPLARIDVPAGTSAITGAMIKDLRPRVADRDIVKPGPQVDGASSAPPAGVPLIRQIGFVATAVSAIGAVTETWPSPFPNGIVHVNIMVIGGTGSAPVVNNGIISKTGAQFIVPSLAGTNTTLRFSYEAIGW